VAISCKHGNEVSGSIQPGNFWTAEYLFIRISRRTELDPVDKSIKYVGSTASHARRPISHFLNDTSALNYNNTQS
jgi:hypothetical protein